MGDLGISIYPSKSSLDEMKDYVFLAARLGYRRIFTSMLEIADNPHETVNQFREIIAYANQLGMRTSIDVNPRLFQILDISYQDLTFFKDLGVWSIRLDEGFTGLEEARMSMNSQGIVVELNISRGQHYIDMVMDFGADKHHLIGSHNFYPQAYTGLDFDYFLKTAKQYKQHNLLTTAFVDSVYGEIAPWPVSQLMVSAEIQRQMPITSQVQLLKMSGVIDDIIISSAFHSKDELEAISHIYHSPVPVLPVKWDDEASHQEKEVVLEPLHMYRGDYSGYMIRSSQTRVMYKEVDFPAHSVRPLQIGDITICNTSVKLINALGGVTVYNDQAFTSLHGNYNFGVGNINLTSGEEALGFVRERYSLEHGDYDRGNNQLKVIQAIVEKLTSFQSVSNYSDVISTLQDSIQTNMPLNTMMSLVNEQLDSGKTFIFSSQEVTGTGSTGQLTSYAMPNASLYMIQLDDASVAKASQAIKNVMEGK